MCENSKRKLGLKMANCCDTYVGIYSLAWLFVQRNMSKVHLMCECYYYPSGLIRDDSIRYVVFKALQGINKYKCG